MTLKKITHTLPGTLRLACTVAVLLATGLSHAATLTLYNAQHPQTVNLLVKDFQKQTGITVKMRNGEGPELAAQLVAEGKVSPADVFLTSNSPELMLLEEKDMLAKAPLAALADIPARFNSPTGVWVGFLAVLALLMVFSPSLLSPSREGEGKTGTNPLVGCQPTRERTRMERAGDWIRTNTALH